MILGVLNINGGTEMSQVSLKAVKKCYILYLLTVSEMSLAFDLKMRCVLLVRCVRGRRTEVWILHLLIISTGSRIWIQRY